MRSKRLKDEYQSSLETSWKIERKCDIYYMAVKGATVSQKQGKIFLVVIYIYFLKLCVSSRSQAQVKEKGCGRLTASIKLVKLY